MFPFTVQSLASIPRLQPLQKAKPEALLKTFSLYVHENTSVSAYIITDNIYGDICILKKGNRIVNCNAHIKLNLATLVFKYLNMFLCKVNKCQLNEAN